MNRPPRDESRIAKEYADISDNELIKSLQQYREHVLSCSDELRAESVAGAGSLSITFDTSARKRPSIDQLKQYALYFDHAVVDDPLFPLTKPPSSSVGALNSYLGLPEVGINRKAIAGAAGFMRSTRAMTAGQFLKFMPLTALFEPPEETPITYSQTLYEERIPERLREWLQSRAQITPLRKHTDRDGWYWRPGDPLEVCRAIAINFEGYEGAFTYFLFETKAKPHPDKRDGHFILTQWIPDTPPSPAQFDAWVRHSINQSAGRVLENLYVDIAHASQSSSMLLTESALLADLLMDQSVESTLSEDMANLAIQLELPILGQLSVEDLMQVRNQHGEAFRNFRLALQKHLREIRTTADPSTLRKRLNNLQHEMQEVQVADVQKEVQRVQREIIRSLVIGAVSLGAVVPTTGWSLAGLAAAAIGSYKAVTGYEDRVKTHPAFLLWKLKRLTP